MGRYSIKTPLGESDGTILGYYGGIGLENSDIIVDDLINGVSIGNSEGY